MHFQFDYFCSVATYDIIFWCRPVYYKKTYSMKQPNLYHFETIKMTSKSKFTENTRLRLVFSIQNLIRLVASFLSFQNFIDQAVS